MPRPRICQREDGVKVGVVDVADEDFRAVNQVWSPCLSARVCIPATFDPRRVRSRSRRPVRPARPCARPASRPAVPLCRQQDRQRGQVIDAHGGADTRTAVSQFFADDALVEHARAGTAVFLGDVQVDQPDPPPFIDDVDRKLGGLVEVAATGIISCAAKSRAIFWSICCSSVKAKLRSQSDLSHRLFPSNNIKVIQAF